MSDGVVSWNLHDLRSAGERLVGDGEQLGSLGQQLPTPPAEMFGSFLANAVAMTEPAATNHNKELAAAAGSATTEIGHRLITTAASYERADRSAQHAAGTIEQLLGQGH